MALIYERDLWPRQSFDPSCPSGGSWYACTTGSRFVGCCSGSVDPCDETTSCPPKNLKPASFDIAEYGTFPDQICDAGSDWYTCSGTNPAFMGCCKSNPCSTGCPTKDLTAASLSSDEAVASAFIATSSASAAPAAASTTTAGTPSNLASSSPGHHVGAIAGGVIGGVAAISLLVISILWCLGRKRRARKNELKRQTMEASYTNEDGYFHDTYPSQSRGTQSGDPETQGCRTTVYSEEDHEGIEVDDRPSQSGPTRPSTADQRLTSATQAFNVSPDISRPPSVSGPPSVGNLPNKASPWFTRDSIFTHGAPQLANIPSPPPEDQRRVSWFENQRQLANNSPIGTPVQSPILNNQSDYFGSCHGHQQQSSNTTQIPTSPLNQYFELDDTQLSPPVELEAIPAGLKKHTIDEIPSAPLQQLPQRRGRVNEEEIQVGSTYFSPDDVGKPQSRG